MAATVVHAATEGFRLGFCECFELDHLVREMNVMGVAQPLSTSLVSSRSFFSPNAATWILTVFSLRNFITPALLSMGSASLVLLIRVFPPSSLGALSFSVYVFGSSVFLPLIHMDLPFLWGYSGKAPSPMSKSNSDRMSSSS